MMKERRRDGSDGRDADDDGNDDDSRDDRTGGAGGACQEQRYPQGEHQEAECFCRHAHAYAAGELSEPRTPEEALGCPHACAGDM